MPTYSYRCDTCGHEFDASQRFSDEPLKECPECGAAIRRVIQPVGVVFKGSGWYITDSRGPEKGAGDSDRPAAKKDSGEAKDAAPAKESAKESSTAAPAEKPAAKAAAD